MATTTNFGWETPDDTDLVKDGAAAIRTLGSAIDTSLVDLKGGTTGQVLSKTSNTDMDFTWVTSDDANAIQNAIVDAKGDLIAASAADTPARLAVGNNGETLVADSSASTGLRWQGDFAAGKNKIINGDFRINQRNFSSITTDATYGFDRWQMRFNTGTCTYSAQTFTPGTAPVAGYEGVNFARLVTSGQTASSGFAGLYQKVEDVRTFAGQVVTLSFWAKASSGTPKIQPTMEQVFGTGGSSSVVTAGTAVTISTSWARYTATITLPSVSGKTISATDSLLQVMLFTSLGTDYPSYGNIGTQAATIDIWGVQLEAGNVATAFQTATGTLAGELAACQRYYWRPSGQSLYGSYGFGNASSTTQAFILVNVPVTLRSVASVSVDFSTLSLADSVNTPSAVTALTIQQKTDTAILLQADVASGLTQYRPYRLSNNNSTSGYVGFSAEL